MALKSQAFVAVVIGRNEGDRLRLSLDSVRNARLPVVYVDSGSNDGSATLALSVGAITVELSPERPFSAARARNEGVEEALRLWPGAEYVLFLDGDCTFEPAFTSPALQTFEDNPNCAIVTGHLSERDPEASIYNRLCEIEWKSPPGPIVDMNGLGGIMAMRVAAFRQVGGFNEQAIAGEEADLGVRLRMAGWALVKIDLKMATHDAQMLRFSQWWRRTVRGGHAMAHRYAMHGNTSLGDGRHAVRSTLLWGFLLPFAALVMLVPTAGASLLLLLGYAFLAWRVYRHYRHTGLDRARAWLATRFIIYGKFAQFLGIVRYGLNRLRGQFHVMDWR